MLSFTWVSFGSQSRRVENHGVARSDLTVKKDEGKAEHILSLYTFKHTAKQGQQSIRLGASNTPRFCQVAAMLKVLKLRVATLGLGTY